MCMICIDLRKDKMSSMEARQNLGELYITLEKEHIYEVLRLIWKKEDEEYAKEYDWAIGDGDTD